MDHLGATSSNDNVAGPLAAAHKLKEYLNQTKQPAIDFLKYSRTLNPKQLPSLDTTYAAIKTSLHFDDSCDSEWVLYLKIAQESQMNGNSSLLAFWKSAATQVPNLAAKATLLLQLPVNSADVERSFSQLKQISDQRQNLKNDNIKGLLKLHYNKLA